MPTLYYYNNTTSTWEPAIVGEQGATGPAGSTGATGIGSTGATGIQGDVGATGEQGATGLAGSAGVDGATGATGPAGSAGSDGATGATGEQGATGPAGGAGSDGATGATGPAGTNGSDGATGATGPQGDTGATGPAGSGTPAGSNNEVQFNSNGAFGSSANFKFQDNIGGGTLDVGGELLLLGNGTIGTLGNNLNIMPAGNLTVSASIYNWTFDNSGNLTLPGNTFAVNYANGTQVPLGGGGNTGNVTFSDQVVQGTGDEAGGSGLYLAPGANSTANLQYLRVRGGDFITHIHLDTGNNNYFDQYFGADSKYVKLEANGNIVINADNGNSSATWTYGTDGNLTLAGGNSVIFSTANSSLDPLIPNVSTMTLTPDANYNSQVLVLDPTAPGHIHLRAHAFSNIDDPAANIFLGGEQTAFEVTSGPNNVARIHSGNLTWTFSNNSGASVIDLPGESYIRSNQDTVNIQSLDANGIGRGIYIGTNGTLYFWDGNSQSVSLQQDNTNANLTATGNASITSNVSTWTFGEDGNLTLPGGYTIGEPGGPSLYISAPNTSDAIQLRWANEVSLTLGNTGAANIAQIGTAGGYWDFDETGNLNAPGSLLPSSDGNYDLGSNANRWRDLYLSGNTIYLGNATLQSSDDDILVGTPNIDLIFGGGAFTMANAANANNTFSIALFDDGADILVNGNVGGNLTFGGGAFVAETSQIIGNVVTSNTANIKNALINISLDVDANASINFKDANGNIAGNILLADDDILINTGPGGNLVFTGGAFIANTTDLRIGNTPSAIVVPVGVPSPVATKFSVVDGTFQQGNGDMWTDGFLYAANGLYAGNGLLLTSGNIELSGDIIAANTASPAPSLSGFSSLSALSANLTGNVTAGNVYANSGTVSAANLVLNGQEITASGIVNASYLFAINNAEQIGLAASGAVAFQTTQANNGSLINKISNTQVTLTGNNTYRLEGIIKRNSSDSTWSQFQWYDVTNSVYVGGPGFGESVTSTSPGVSSTIVSTAYVTPSTNTTYELRSTVNTVTVNQYMASMEITQVNPALVLGAISSLGVTGNVDVGGSLLVDGNIAVNGPAFSAYASAATSITGSDTKVNFQTEEFDTNNNYDTGTSRFTPTVAGYYQVTVSVMVPNTSAVISAILYKNGSKIADGPAGAGSSTFYSSSMAQKLVYMNGTTDYLEGYAICNSTLNTFTGITGTYFQATMVRGA